MELILDLALAPIIGFLLSNIIKRLPAKIQLFFGSLIIALIATLILWSLFVTAFKPDFAGVVGQTLTAISILYIVLFVLIFFSINHFQTRQRKHNLQSQFALASDLIRGYQFQKALDILRQMKHPQAREWEAILHEIIRNDPEFLQQLESTSMT